MPGDVKLPGWQTKAMLRDAVGDLVPPEILNRPKMGFPVPVGRWFRGELGAIVDEFVLGPRATARVLRSFVAATDGGRTPRRAGQRTATVCGCSSTSRSGFESSATVKRRHGRSVTRRARHSRQFMRILWVKMGGLWPPTSGGRIRSLETLSGCRRATR